MRRIISISIIGIMVCVGFLALSPANVSADGTPFEYLSEEWRFSTQDAYGLAVEDLDGDGIPELIVGGSGYVYVVNTITHTQEWVSGDLGGGYIVVDTGDVDNDNETEIVACTGNYIYIFDAISGVQEAEINLGYSFVDHPIAVGDIDNDDTEEIVVAAANENHNYYGFYLFIYGFDGMNYTEEWSWYHNTFESHSSNHPRCGNVVLTDVDNDNVTEITATYNDVLWNSPIRSHVSVLMWNGQTHTEEWSVSFEVSEYWWEGGALDVGDIDADGTKEIIIGITNPDVNGYLYVYDGITKEQEQSYSLGRYVYGVGVGNIDADYNAEIIAGVDLSLKGPTPYIYVFDGITKIQEWSDGLNVNYVGRHGSMMALDIDFDEQIELIVGSDSGILIFGNPPPIAYIDTISPSPARVGEEVYFDCHGTDDEGVAYYNWTSSLDGQIGTSKSFTKSDLSYGTHTIYLRVQDTEGLWSETVSTTLTVGIAPNATIDSISHTIAIVGNTVSFNGHGDDSDGSISVYQWVSNIDGLLSNSASFNTVSLSIGKHTITFRVKDNDNLWSDNVTENLIVTAKPTAYIDSISPNPALLGTTVTFNGHGYDSDGSITAYNWTSDIDGLLSTSQSFNTNSLSLGHHTIYYTVKDNNNIWSNHATMTLIVGTKPSASINSITPKPVVEGETVSFSGSGSDSDGNILAYLWNSSINGQLSTHSSFSTSNLLTGTHTIYFKVQDDDGFWSNEATDTIKVLAKPTAYIDYVQPTPSVFGDSVSFCGHGSDTDGSIVDYEWASNLDGKLSNSSLFTVSTLSSGSHTISFKVKDNDGLWSPTVTTTVTVSKKPTAYIDTINPNPSKVGESVSFMGHGVDDDGSIVAYSWVSNISGTISTNYLFSTASLSAGKHLISFKVQDNSGLWSDEATATLEVRQSPVASLTVEPTEVYINELVSFDGSNSYQTSGTITHYFFDFDDGTNSSWTASPTTTHKYSSKGIYYAKLKVKDNYGIESSWSSVKITVQETPVLILTAGLINVGIIKSGGERVVPVYVTCYNVSAKNIHIVVVESSGFIITMIPEKKDVNVDETVTFNLRLTAPELASNVTVGEKVIQIKAVSDETESNVETIYIVLEKGAGTEQPKGFIPSFETTTFLVAIIGVCIILLRKRKALK